MAIASIATLKAAMGAGVRPNLFKVSFAAGTNGGVTGGITSDISFLVKAAALPASTVGVIDTPFMAGRRYKIAGDRSFGEWTMTVLNDSNYVIRRLLEDDQRRHVGTDYTAAAVGSVSTVTRNTPNQFTTVTVEQLNDQNATIRTYALQNCFISDISTIDLSYDSVDTLEEFTVTWAYDYFTLS